MTKEEKVNFKKSYEFYCDYHKVGKIQMNMICGNLGMVVDRLLKSQRQEIIEKIKEKRKNIRGLDEYDKYNRTEIYKKSKSYNEAVREIINLIKEDE